MDEVLVTVREQDADPAERERLAGLLRAELSELDVDRVRPALGGPPPPPGARGVDAATVGALVVSLTPTVELLRSLLSSVRSWLGRGPSGRSVELTIGTATVKLTNASAETEERLVDEFVRAAALQG